MNTKNDYVLRQDVIKEIHAFFMERIERTPTIEDEDGEHYITNVVEPILEDNKELSNIIKSLPDAKKHGEWVLLEECANEGVYCSICHKKVYRLDYSNTMKLKSNFCPHCGADMREGK